LRKRIVIWTQFSFDLPRQRRSQPAVTGIRQSSFLNIFGEFGFTSLGLHPLELFARAPIERDTSRATLTVNGPAPWLRRRFVSRNSEGSDANRSEKFWHNTVSDCFSSKRSGNQLGIESVSQLDQEGVPKLGF
jgi:hypothetical protein